MSRIPTSGVMTWTDVQNSFGGSNPIGINEYYRNASLVSSSALNSNIPTSGQIEATDFRGADGFSGTTGTFSCGTSGGKLPSGGFEAGSYGSDLGMAFTAGNGVKITCYALAGLGGVVYMRSATISPNTITNSTSSNIQGRTMSLSGAVSFSGVDNNSGTASQTVPASYGDGSAGVQVGLYSVTLPTSGNVNVSYS